MIVEDKSTREKRILIVDDEEDILEILTYNLRKEGYETRTASNGVEGIEVIKEFKPHLILLDVMMPEMDGVEMCKRLRENTDYNNILIAFLTARSEDYTQITALELGGDDYITKPIKPGVLISRVKALLRRSVRNMESEIPTIIEAGELKINTEEFLVYNEENKPLEMPRKEFQLLSLLASKPGKVFTRDEILNNVWGKDVIVGNRTIDVHVRKLRNKLGSHYIKTVKGIGYKFDF